MSALDRPSDPLTVRLSGPGLAAQLSRVRQRVAEWAASMGMAEDDVDDLVLATHEALANVADHAYPNGDGEAWLDARRCGPDELAVTVRDQGRWRPPPPDPGRRGHGMTIIAGLAKHVEVRHDDDGTTIEMWWAVPPLP